MKKTRICKTIDSSTQKPRNWLSSNKYLLLRRFSQLGILFLFLLGPWFDIWIIKGNLSSSLVLDTLPLSDPFVLLQSFFAGHFPAREAIIGALIIVLFYFIVGGRTFCSWVCPVNIITDTAAWLRFKLGIKSKGGVVSNKMRYYLLAMSLVLAYLTGSVVWELVNPVSILHRGIIFGMTFGWVLIALIFLFDLFVMRNGWCSRLCPMGAFYSLIGRGSLLRIGAIKKQNCNDCLDCYIVCPESRVINPVLKGKENLVLDGNCTNCARCIDVCEPQVFSYSSRFKKNNK